MNFTCSDLKADARKKLLGNYTVLICAYLIAQIIQAIISVPFSRMVQEGICFLAPSRIIMGSVGSILVALIVMLLSSGQSYMSLQIGYGKKPQLKDMFFCCINRPDKYIGFNVIILVLALVCVIPGTIVILIAANGPSADSASAFAGAVIMIIGSIIIIYLSITWAMTLYLLFENADMKVTEAMKTSRQMMIGYKWKYFKLMLSFIGLALLGLLSLGLGLLWVSPYITQANTEFYLKLKP